MNGQVVFTLPRHESLGERLRRHLDADPGVLTVRTFPDGETFVRGETPCEGRDAILAANLYRPDPQILPLIYCARAIRLMGARRIFLVSPYLPYMRQDARFAPGEVVTSRLFARLISETVDGLVTVDPHLHRYTDLNEIYSIHTRVAQAAPSIAKWIHTNVHNPVIVGPDSESEQWVTRVAELAQAPFVVLKKTRRGDRDVEIEVPPLAPWIGFTPVLVDDIISTARTMIETIAHLTFAGYAAPVCVGVHGVFAGDAYHALKEAGAADIVTSNTVSHPSNRIDVTGLLAQHVRELLAAPLPESNSTKDRS